MTGSSVPPGFRLPWNTTRTMADVFAARAEKSSKGGKATAQKKREKFVREVRGKRRVTPDGKVPFAGYDVSEVQVRKVSK